MPGRSAPVLDGSELLCNALVLCGKGGDRSGHLPECRGFREGIELHSRRHHKRKQDVTEFLAGSAPQSAPGRLHNVDHALLGIGE